MKSSFDERWTIDSPDVSAASMAQLNAAAALWPQAAATAATLAAFMPKTGMNPLNPMNAFSAHADQMEEMFQAPKKVPSPIGTGKPKSNFNPAYNQTFNQANFMQTQFDNRHQNHSMSNQQSPFSQFNRNQQRMKNMHMKKTHNSYGGAKMNNKMEKPKQGPFNKVLIVGLAPEYRSLNGVLGKKNTNASNIIKNFEYNLI